MLANYNYFSFNNRDHEHYPRGPPPPEVGLSEMLQSCAAPIVGLDKVREIKSESWRMLLYICTICRVRVEISNFPSISLNPCRITPIYQSAAGSSPSVGNADFMLDHLTSHGHMRSYFEFEYDIKNEALARILASDMIM